MSKYGFAALLVIMIHPASASANGGPVAWTGITPVGAIGLKDTRKVSLLQEDLEIRITDLNSYSVKADYHLNAKAAIGHLQFGVPINWANTKQDATERAELIIPHDGSPPKWVARQIGKISKNIKIEINGRRAGCRPVYNRHQFPFSKTSDGEPGKYTQVEAWCVADIPVRRGKNRILLRYRAELDYMDMGYSMRALAEHSDRVLEYLLYPAGYWNGVADKVHIRIDPGVYRGYAVIKQPEGFVKTGTDWTWKGQKVDLKKVSKLEITLGHGVDDAYELATWNKRNSRTIISKLRVSASSELRSQKGNNYRATNVLDGDPATAWCEGVDGNGAGQYLEFRSSQGVIQNIFNSGCVFEGLAVSNGYLKNQHVYMLNNRISKIAISNCQGGDYSEVSNMAKGIDVRFGTEFIQQGHTEFIPAVSCFRIKILDTSAGKVNDTCISEVSMVVNCH